jgi:hypothetical protein
MKTERLTLLVSPVDKAAIAARAAALNMSVSELVRRAALDYDPEEEAIREELETLLPAFNAAVANIEANLHSIVEAQDRFEERMVHLRSDEYRDLVRREIAEDPNIDWLAIRRLFGGDIQDREAAA